MSFKTYVTYLHWFASETSEGGEESRNEPMQRYVLHNNKLSWM